VYILTDIQIKIKREKRVLFIGYINLKYTFKTVQNHQQFRLLNKNQLNELVIINYRLPCHKIQALNDNCSDILLKLSTLTAIDLLYV